MQRKTDSKPTTQRQEIEYRLQRLKHFRYNYSDEIPEYEIHSESANPRYKCRTGWWQGLVGQVFSLKSKGLLSQRIIREGIKLYWDYCSLIKKEEFGVNQEYIERANSLLDKVIKVISNRLEQGVVSQ